MSTDVTERNHSYASTSVNVFTSTFSFYYFLSAKGKNVPTEPSLLACDLYGWAALGLTLLLTPQQSYMAGGV